MKKTKKKQNKTKKTLIWSPLSIILSISSEIYREISFTLYDFMLFKWCNIKYIFKGFFFPLDLCIIFSKDINPQTPQAIEFKRICKGDGLNVESWFLSSCPVSMMLFKTWDMEVSNVSEVM